MSIKPCQRYRRSSIIALKTLPKTDLQIYDELFPEMTERKFPIGCIFPFYYHGALHRTCAKLLPEDSAWLKNGGVTSPDVRICSIMGLKESVTADSFLVCSNIDGNSHF